MTGTSRFPVLGPLLSALVIGLLSGAAAAAEDDEEALPVYRPGLVATLSQPGRPPVVRVDDDVQFVARAGTATDERLAPGPLDAAWRGRLFSLAPGEYRLHVFLQGRATIRLNSTEILQATAAAPTWHESLPVKLSYGHHPLEIDYHTDGAEGTCKLHWSGPQFGVEPIPERHLFHDPGQTPATSFEDGRLLVRALRCAACHAVPGETSTLPAPALTHLAGNLDRRWLVEWLTPSDGTLRVGDPARRRMPHLPLNRDDAEAIADYLFATSQPSTEVKVPEAKEPPPAEPVRDADSKKKPKPRTAPWLQAGKLLTHGLGCLACHRLGELGSDGLFAGPELTQIATKRPAEFFVRWFDDASRVNASHRMPQFKLEPLERADLTVYLMTLQAPKKSSDLFGSPRPGTPGRGAGGEGPDTAKQLLDCGRKLVAEHRCGACHKLAEEVPKPESARPLTAAANWNAGCLGDVSQTGPRRPGYGLDEARRRAIFEYVAAARPEPQQPSSLPDGRFVLVERNCIGCHARGLGTGLADRVAAIAAAQPELAAAQAALVPPALHGIGDKLTDDAFLAAVKTERPPSRAWLKVRMPKFALSESETTALQRYLVDHDRVPDRPAPTVAESDDVAQRLAARRLVTADGFGCTSCHKIGKAEPAGTISLATRGTDLSLLGERIRKPWFDRWVRNPARIIPRMEMPAVQLAVRGVLHDDVNEQLAAVWKVLNEPGFTPPLPNPVRIVRARNVSGIPERPHVLTDVFLVDGETYVSPIVIGLPNRHNILFDLEKNRLAAWWTGDTALERTKGKSWYWEPGGAMVCRATDRDSQELTKQPENASEFHISAPSHYIKPTMGAVFPSLQGQNLVGLDGIRNDGRGVEIHYRIAYSDPTGPPTVLKVTQTWKTLPHDPQFPSVSGLRRTWEIRGLPKDRGVVAFPMPENRKSEAIHTRITTNRPPITFEDKQAPGSPRVVLRSEAIAGHQWDKGDFVARTEVNGVVRIEVDYLVDLPLDTFPNELPTLPNPPTQKLDVVPGYDAVRLPLPAGEMPTGLDWMRDGTLVFASLKGRIFSARDTDGDEIEDSLTPLSDDLATPYGLAVAQVGDSNARDREAIDVITKPALVRLHDDNRDGFYERQEIVADGWGHTDDYHDWAVGLPRIRNEDGSDGGYYVALPCMQDDRDEAKARLRGQALKLVPREPTKHDPRRFAIEPFCGGLRFPMGLAVDRRGRLFASDNQGNYNPFNELNHLQAGKRYGFINKNERAPDFKPPTESPAVEIPHPWTRSVNGLCFLDTPEPLTPGPSPRRGEGDHNGKRFGPFEGHLLGCEFNQRMLVRMSLEEVDGVVQGAIYPFSLQPADPNAPTFEGPNVAAVAPDGDLYVGNLRDSGWGGGQNTGSIVRIVPRGDLAVGIAEVRATPDGFALRFTGEIDARRAADRTNYTIEKYRRESTPQYGGDDLDRSTVAISALAVSDDRREVRLQIDRPTTGFVYEFHLENLTPDGAMFFPAEAHYTLKRLPR
jgi:mono/diheme cytochrome c family protein/glucose/arabinose dehydrogenase